MALNDYYMNFEDVLAGLDEKDPRPTKKDLQPGKIYIDQKAFSDIHGFLQDHRYCLVEGAERRGKTTLVRFTGLSYIENWEVRQVDVSRVENKGDLAEFKEMLEKSLDIPNALIIIEDCHTKPEITKAILIEVEKCRNASFLFTMRTIKQKKYSEIGEPFEDSVIREKDWVVRLEENEETVYNNIKGIVEKFCEIHSSDLKYKSTEAMPSSDDYQYLVEPEQTGGNKRILEYYLGAWLNSKDPDLALRQVDRRRILEQFRKERLAWLLTKEVKLEVLQTMSALGQFEIPIITKALFSSDVSKLDFGRATDELSSLKGLAFRYPQGKWLLADTESRLTLECLENLKIIDSSFVYNVLRTYIIAAANYFEVLHSLHRVQKQDLLISLAEDTEVYNSLVCRLGEAETTLSEMLYVLHAIGWADKVIALNLWSEYKKTLGEVFMDVIQRKLLEAKNIGPTWLLLHFLSTIDKEGEAIPFINALPAKVFIDHIRMTYSFLRAKRTLDRVNAISPGTQYKVLRELSESDYRELGEEARGSSLQTINWFLRWLGEDEKLKRSGIIFLEALGEEHILESIKSQNLQVFANFEKYANRISRGWADKLTKRLDFPWYELLNNSIVSGITNMFYRWALRHDADLRRKRKSIVKYWAARTGELRFAEGQKARQVEYLGRLLFYSYYLDEDAAKEIATKAVAAFDPVSMGYTLEDIAYLIRNSRWCNPAASQQLVEKVFSSDAASLLEKGDLDRFSQLIWEAALSNEPKTQEWVAEAGETFWENLAASSTTQDAFRLLLALWQANEELGSKIACAVGRQLLVSPGLTGTPQIMPLLGFLAFCGSEFHVDLSFTPAENVEELYVHPAIPRMACSLFYLQKSKPEVIPDFIKTILSYKGIATKIAPILAEYQLPWTATALQDILISAKNEGTAKREDFYDRMVLLFIAIQPKRIYFNTMLNEMCSPQFVQQDKSVEKNEGEIEHEEWEIRSRATIRLNTAIDKEIFSLQKMEHPVTHKASQIIHLNRDHPQVNFSLAMISNLLYALHETQSEKGWASGKVWDAALFATYRERESLSPLQLRYWKEILLKMNVVNVDYQKADEGKWIVAFSVNDDHPLVKSLIAKS